jgi:putative ABC transport system permease protein
MGGLSSVLFDLRSAIRLLRTSPGFSAVAIGTIALAMGANTAMFSFVNGLLLRPLPYPDSDGIVRVLERLPSGGLNGVSTLNYLDWAGQNRVFEAVAAEAGWSATVTGRGEPLFVRGAQVSARYFDIFGVSAAMGRTFTPDEDRPGRDRVVLVSHAFWEARFGSDPGLVGRAIEVDGEPFTVVGVLPRGPFDRAAAQMWKPLAFHPSNMTRDYRWLGASARLKSGATLAQARAEMDVIARRLAIAHPESNKDWGVAVDRLADVVVSPQLRTAVTVLFAATALVLLIGCANLASLALARGVSMEGERAVRAALGASRWRLVQQVLIENLALALCGGVVGLGVGYVLMKWILSLIPPYALPPAADVRLDTAVLLFSLAVSLVAGLLFGAVPAVRVTRASLSHALKDGGQGTTVVGRGRRVHGAFVVVEVALAFVLLVASGVLMRSVVELLEIDPGFTAANVLTSSLPIRQEQHPDTRELNTYVASLRAAVESVPGVRDTAVASALPLQGWGFGVPYSIAGRPVTPPARRRPAFFKIVSPSYFDVLGIKLVAGRLLRDSDRAGSSPVTVINDTLARREFAAEEAIGRRILVRQLVPGQTGLGNEIPWEIVGVIANERITGLGDDASAGMYVSNEQSPTYALNLVIRSSVPPQSLQTPVQVAVQRVNRRQSLSDVRTLEQIVSQSMLGNRVVGAILALFAAMALLLASMGIYGVVSYTAAQRRQEMGVRAALGATEADLRSMVLRSGMRLTWIGLTIGIAGTMASRRVLSSMLYGVAADDIPTIGVVAALLAGIAALACFIPAWRMTRVNPIDALRSPAGRS